MNEERVREIVKEEIERVMESFADSVVKVIERKLAPDPEPTEPTPEPGVRVVGWIAEYVTRRGWGAGTIIDQRSDDYTVPVILQSDHEEIVERLEWERDAAVTRARDRYNEARNEHRAAVQQKEKAQQRSQAWAMEADRLRDEITRLRAEIRTHEASEQHAEQQAEEALARAEKAERERDEYQRAYELASTRADRAESAEDMLRRERDGEVWCWQGDEEDHPESLGCPVLMDPHHLREMLAKIAQLSDPANWEAYYKTEYWGLLPRCRYVGPESPPESEGGDHG